MRKILLNILAFLSGAGLSLFLLLLINFVPFGVHIFLISFPVCLIIFVSYLALKSFKGL